jgi:hypothetical protein
MELKEILSQIGIKCSDEKLAELEAVVQVKKVPRTAKKWVAVEGAAFGAKTPLQMKQCVEALGTEPADMKTWVEKLAAVDGFKTAQPVERIVAFYKKRMIDEGLVREA